MDGERRRWNLRDENDAKKIRARIIQSYTRMVGSNGAEDCAQEIFARMLEGRHQHSTIEQAVIDYLRQTRGRKGIRGHAQRKAFFNPSSFEQENHDGTVAVNVGRSLESRVDSELVARRLRGKERAVWLLIFEYGFTLKEVGSLFGVTESRISQWVAGISTRLRSIVSACDQDSETRESIERESVASEALDLTGDVSWADTLNFGSFISS